MDMDLQDLRYFCMAAELEHITQAAEILGISQPFLTKVIRRLEGEIGVPLFLHVGRKVALSDYGQVFYTRAKHLIMEADNLKVEMAELRGRQEHTISLVTNVVVYVPYIIDAFHDRYPDYTVLIKSTHSRRIQKAMHTGSADFALCAKPLDEDMNIGLKTRIVHHESSMIMLPPEHPLRSRPERSLKDLHRQPLIISPLGFGMRSYIDELLSRHGVQPQIIVETGEVADIIRFVRKGIGCAFLPKGLIMQVPSLRADCFELADIGSPRPVGLSYRDLPYRTKANRDFLSFVESFFQKSFSI